MQNNIIEIRYNTCIVLPCYNEENGISIDEYSGFLDKTQNILICFVNDGSSDNTIGIIQVLKQKYPDQIHILNLEKNLGKAEAVRSGINYCNQNYTHKHIGYLDADLATTLEEFVELQKYLVENISFCFGSRILKLGSVITRKNSRFLIGRIIATFISNVLQLKIYDTQCGCKIFTKELSLLLFKEKFISKWLFDVELFYRMKIIYGKENAIQKMAEIPLKSWTEKGNSKVKVTYFFRLWYDLYQISNSYRNNSTDFI
ncbi:glycosyltransferase [Flavobacterium sp. ZT3R25]|uniref:glycosyltransferase n=1 Tax=Flavobacterium galactosi TaxID=3398735 RepID=UPI003A874564